MPGYKAKLLADRFWNKVAKGRPDECWPFLGYRMTNGYGNIGVGSRTDGTKRMRLAHRVAWELTHGPIKKGLHVCHHCDNPPCCNPAHLFLGTPKDNMRDASQKNRLKGWVCNDNHYLRQRTECQRGHPFDEANTYYLPDGTRECRNCRREASRRWHAKHRGTEHIARPRLNSHNRKKTHCPKGHPYDEENVCLRNGRRHCRKCRQINSLTRLQGNKG